MASRRIWFKSATPQPSLQHNIIMWCLVFRDFAIDKETLKWLTALPGVVHDHSGGDSVALGSLPLKQAGCGRSSLDSA